MVEVAAVRGAVVVSVGPEPGGAPASVLHLGGGPSRFCEILEEQLAVEARLGPFATPRDASWIIEESGFDVAREHEIESLMAIANGYLGSRASIAEGSSVSRPATFLAGAFEPSNDYAKVPELVILPDWGRVRVSVEGEPLTVERGVMQHHRRILDMRRGVLLREGVAHAAGGYVTSFRTVHAASLASRHLMLEGIELTPRNYSGSARLDAILTGDVQSASGASHWAEFTPVGGDEGPIPRRAHSQRPRRGARFAYARSPERDAPRVFAARDDARVGVRGLRSAGAPRAAERGLPRGRRLHFARLRGSSRRGAGSPSRRGRAIVRGSDPRSHRRLGRSLAARGRPKSTAPRAWIARSASRSITSSPRQIRTIPRRRWERALSPVRRIAGTSSGTPTSSPGRSTRTAIRRLRGRRSSTGTRPSPGRGAKRTLSDTKALSTRGRAPTPATK